MYGEMTPLYSTPFIKQIVELTARESTTWADMMNHPQLGGEAIDGTRFHLLWLVKYGLIEWA
jgi:hypothetical protein